MLERLYVEALLTDTELADSIWDLLDRGLLSDRGAARAWAWLVFKDREVSPPVSPQLKAAPRQFYMNYTLLFYIWIMVPIG